MLQIAITQPSTCAIKRFETMKDDTHDSTYLFITDSKWNQWRLLLERRTTGYTWCNPSQHSNTQRHRTESRNETTASFQGEKKEKIIHNDDITLATESASDSVPSQQEGLSSHKNADTKTAGNDDIDETVSGSRSRLAGLKQLSFASLTNIRQKISEGRKLLASASTTKVIGFNSDTTSSEGCINTRGSFSSQEGRSAIPEGVPEALNTKVGGTRLSVQQAITSKRTSQSNLTKSTPLHGTVVAGLFPETAILTFHNIELEVLPQVPNEIKFSY